MSTGIDITFNTSIGSRGSSPGQFDYPAGVVVLNDKVYVCDKQNHRIQRFTLSGSFETEFGTQGSGNDNFYFPEGITTDEVFLYVCDSANHRIKIHDADGLYISEFGTSGTGNTNFKYPTDITFKSPYLYIADKSNNRIKIHDTGGAYVDEWGTYGVGDLNLKLPEGISWVDDKIVVADTGNKAIKFYDTSGVFDKKITNVNWMYPTSVDRADEVLIVIDSQGSKLYFYDTDDNLITSYDTGLNFPDSVWYADSVLFLTDSADHQLNFYDLFIQREVPAFANIILRLTKLLYPTGRAWNLIRNSIFHKLHDALSYSEARAYKTNRDMLYSILPDNDYFSEQNATDWESTLGLVSTGLTFEQRKTQILRKMQFPGNAKARQHYLFLQGQLQNAGFDVYVHEFFSNPINPIPAIYGIPVYGEVNYGSTGISGYEILANYIDSTKDEDYQFGTIENLNYTIFIGGEVFGTFANVLLTQKQQFRELILKIKAAHVGVLLLINYT